PAVTDGTSISNTADASASSFDPDPANNSITNTTTAKRAQIVISQLYGGGGNSGAQLKNDYIEIFNRGTTTVDLNGWSVQEVSDVGAGTWAVTALCPAGPCLLAPGKYFLVQEAAGAGGTLSLPAPDVIGTFNLPGSAGKVALLSSPTPLSGACPTNANILDIVGYGATASCFEGSGPAPSASNTTAVFRKSGGCIDTDNNASDLIISAPNPRNSSALANDCTSGFRPDISINDVTVTEGNSGTVNAVFNVTLSAASLQQITVSYTTAHG